MKNHTALYFGYVPAGRQRGLSLVELMISLTIGLVLLTGITSLIVQQSATRNELEKSSRQIENGRYATQILRDDIEHAGFYGEYSPPAAAIYTTPDPCDFTDNTANINIAGAGNLGWINNSFTTPTLPVTIFGYDGPALTLPLTCATLVTNYQPNTDILVVRRTATTPPIAAAGAVAGTTYLQVSRCSTDTRPFMLGTNNFDLFQRDCLPLPGPGTAATLRNYVVHIYYISSCSVCGTDTIPTLKMVEFINGAQTVYPLVEGIENMQFDYGVDATLDGSPDNYITAPAAADWPNVMAVRVNLLARNNDPTTGYTDIKTYCLSGNTALCVAGNTSFVSAPNDGFKRHVYSQLVRAINPSGRRAP